MNLTIRHHHLVQLYHIVMAQRLKELNLTHSSDRKAIPFGLHPYSLEGNMEAIEGVTSFIDLAERPFANLADNGVQFLALLLRRSGRI